MHWHVITGSKGGIGKTLLTLLLLEYHLEKKPKEGILVLDLNATNADTSDMLQYSERNIHQIAGDPIPVEKNGQEITLQKVLSTGENGTRYFVVGWPTNPFTLYGTDQFPQLLSTVKQLAGDIAQKTALPALQHVIIDTNYHFCNLFPEMDEHYEMYTTGELKDDIVTIWFIWVYRQLYRLLRGEKQARLMKNTALAIERQLKKGGVGPIVHTYTPVGLLPVEPGQQGFFSKRFGWGDANHMVRRDHDHLLEKISRLESLSVGKYIGFEEWTRKLMECRPPMKKSEDTHLLFIDLLDEAIRQLGEKDKEGASLLPVNIFLLSMYQSALEGYTDKYKTDIVAGLRKITLYKNFEKLLERKYESISLQSK